MNRRNIPFNPDTMSISDAKEAARTLSQILRVAKDPERSSIDVAAAVWQCVDHWEIHE